MRDGDGKRTGPALSAGGHKAGFHDCPPESAFRKQDAANSGQIWGEQFEGAAPIFSRSPLVSTTALPDGALGGKPVKASIEIPRIANIARANSDLTILSC